MESNCVVGDVRVMHCDMESQFMKEQPAPSDPILNFEIHVFYHN